jgi:hypothetical protein
VRPSPPLQRHAEHCGHPRCCWGARGQDVATIATVSRTSPPVDGTLELARGGGRTTNHYAATLEAAPVRAQDAPRRLDWSRIRQDGHQLRGTDLHTSTRRKIVRHACKLLPSWSIKGGAVPRPQGANDGQRSPTRSSSSPRYWHLPQSIPLGLGGSASSPTTLVAPLYEHHGAKQYNASSTPLLDVRPRPEPG